MMWVFIINQHRQPCAPVHPAEARRLLKDRQAAVFRRYPFTLILTTVAPQSANPTLRLKIDPGSKTTGIALVDDHGAKVVWAAELTHRGQRIRTALLARRTIRRSRRGRHTRYRQARFLNRRQSTGWLQPSLESRISNIETWVRRLRQVAPIGAVALELVRFDTQLMEDAEISGIEYQQGALAGYEIRQYLLEKWDRRCAYCGKTDIPLQIEHLIPRIRGGSNRVTNLTLACENCNQRKGASTAVEFGYPHLMAQAQQPLQDAAAVNSTRWMLYRRLLATGLPLEIGTGGRTQFNRTIRNLPKTHWIDAACIGSSTPQRLKTRHVRPLIITATGHGIRQMAGVNAAGFPVRHRSRRKRHYGFQTGDIVRAIVPSGKRAGIHVGRVLCRASGIFDITTSHGRQAGISHRVCSALHRQDGYAYTT